MTIHYADFHIHTCCSDGDFTTSEIVERACQLGIDIISITDHNTVDGVSDAKNRAEQRGITVIPGIELSIDYPCEMHLLGYYIDIDNRTLLTYIKEKMEAEFIELLRLLHKIHKHFPGIDMDKFLKVRRVNAGSIADVLIAQGYASDRNDVQQRYLGKTGFLRVERNELKPAHGIELIRQAGGVAVLAHPGRMGLEDQELFEFLKELRKMGIGGLECYHASHNEQMEAQCCEMAKDLGLLISGGSDYHGLGRRAPREEPQQRDFALGILKPFLDEDCFLRCITD